jgi:hypothetical protein
MFYFNRYSYCYRIDLDSLFRTVDVDSLLIEANVYVNNSQNAGLVISIEGSAEDIYMVAYLPIGISNKSWSYSYVNSLICRNKHSSGMIKVYLYNFGNKPVYVDDFRLCVKDGRRF